MTTYTKDDIEVARRTVFSTCIANIFDALGYDGKKIARKCTSATYAGIKGDIAITYAISGSVDEKTAKAASNYKDDKTFIADNADLFRFPKLIYYRTSDDAFGVPWKSVMRPFIDGYINADGRYDTEVSLFDMKG